MRVKEVAERLEVGVGTVYALVGAGRLKCVRVGLGRGTIRITEDQLAEFMAGATTGPKVQVMPTPRPKQYVPRRNHRLPL